MSDWPAKLGGNDFGLCKFDPEKPLTLQVRTWSNVFGPGGSLVVEGFDDEGKAANHRFASITLEHDGRATYERDYLRDLVDEFNENRDENWRDMIICARERVIEFYASQARDYAEKLERAKAGDFS